MNQADRSDLGSARPYGSAGEADMKIRCPGCGARGSAGESMKGQRVRCPKCATVFIVPEPHRHLLPPAAPASHPPSRSEAEFSNSSIENGLQRHDDIQPGDEKEAEQAPEIVEDELRAELEGLLAGTCSACGKSMEETGNSDRAEKLYCRDCLEEAQDRQEGYAPALEKTAAKEKDTSTSKEVLEKEVPVVLPSSDFSAGALIRASWQMTSGVKGSIWAGIVVMLLLLLTLGIGIVYLLTFSGARAGTLPAIWLNLLSQLLSIALSLTFLAGLTTIGVRRVAAQSFSWKLVFSGFSRLLSVTVAGFLMLLLITCGFFLLVLPGVYLAVGYSLALPLIVDKGLGPWQAMEMSRRAVQQKWWRIFTAYLLMYLVYFLSMIPFGIGMIWTVPMFFTLTGVTYRLLFGREQD